MYDSLLENYNLRSGRAAQGIAGGALGRAGLPSECLASGLLEAELAAALAAAAPEQATNVEQLEPAVPLTT